MKPEITILAETASDTVPTRAHGDPTPRPSAVVIPIPRGRCPDFVMWRAQSILDTLRTDAPLPRPGRARR